MNLPIEGWIDLRRAGKGDGRLEIPSVPSNIQTGYGFIRFSLGHYGEPRLLVPCSSTRVRVTAEPTEKLGLHIRTYSGPDGRQAYIDIVCHDTALETVFSELAAEVLRRVEQGGAPEHSVSGAIEDFRSLLSKSSSGPDRAKILGLVGELFMLSQFVERNPSALTLWLGPWEQRHDFRAGGMSMEVKASARSDTTRVSIHGADQLLPPKDGFLVLVQLRFEQATGAPLSIGGLFDTIIHRAHSAERLRDGMNLVGCKDPHDPLWNRYSFSLEAQHAWEVRKDFPRITPKEFHAGVLPGGISGIEYTLDLSMADAFKMTPEELEKYMQRMCDV